MANYLKYIGSDANHSVGVRAAGEDREGKPTAGTFQTVHAGAGQVIALDPAIAAAVLTEEPTLWRAVSGFDA